jgi:four helix bundle protein
MDFFVEEGRDLPDRTFRFAQVVRRFVNRLPRLLSNVEDGRQVVRSSGSVASNYSESQEAVSRKDFFYRIKVARKEARESWLWLRLLEVEGDRRLERERDGLVLEADELVRILTTIAKKDDTGDE